MKLNFYFARADWEQLEEKCSEIICDMNSNVNLREWSSTFCGANHCAAMKKRERKKHLRRKKLVLWGSKACTKAVAARNQAFSKLRKYPVELYAIEYKRLRAAARRVIAMAKKNSWRICCETLQPETPLSKVWSVVHRRALAWLLDNGVEAISDVDKAHMFVKVFQAVHNLNNHRV